MSNYIKSFVTGHGVIFQANKKNLPAFEEASKLWRQISDGLNINDKSVIMLCGAKSNGKSNLLRYLINLYNDTKPGERQDGQPAQISQDIRDIDDDDEEEEEAAAAATTLDENRAESERFVYLVDYDPGQSEVTPPGIVSAHIVRASGPKLVSPTYLNVHQHEPVMMSSAGHLNVNVNPRIYMDNCRYVYNQVRKVWLDRRAPIFINTMGYIRNVGLAVLIDQIKITRPTNLIVLNIESDPMRTIYADLSPSVVHGTRASFYYEPNHQQNRRKLNYRYDLHNLPFTFVDNPAMSTKNRTAQQLAYMAAVAEAPYKPIMKTTPKWVQLDRVSIYCVSSYPLNEGIVLELLLRSWVHLVKLKRPSVGGTMQQDQLEGNTVSGMEQTGETTSRSGEQVTNSRTDARGPVFCKIIDDVGQNKLLGCGIVADIDLERRRLAIITPVEQEVLDQQVDCVIKPLSLQVPREMLPDSL